MQAAVSQLNVRHLPQSSFQSTIVAHAISRAVIRRTLTAEAPIQSQAGLYAICGGQSDSGTGFSPSTSFSIATIMPPFLHTHSFTCHRRCMMLVIDSVVE